MLGSGAVALGAKAHGFDVTAGDIAERSLIVGRPLVANSDVRLHAIELRALLREDAPRSPLPPSWRGRLAPELLDLVSRLRAWAYAATEPRRSLRLLLLIKVVLRVFPMSAPPAPTPWSQRLAISSGSRRAGPRIT